MISFLFHYVVLCNYIIEFYPKSLGVPQRPPHINIVASDTNSLRLYVETGQPLTTNAVSLTTTIFTCILIFAFINLMGLLLKKINGSQSRKLHSL